MTNGNLSHLWTRRRRRRRLHHRVTQQRDRRWLSCSSAVVRGKHFRKCLFSMRCVFQFYHFAVKRWHPRRFPHLPVASRDEPPRRKEGGREKSLFLQRSRSVTGVRGAGFHQLENRSPVVSRKKKRSPPANPREL